MNAYLIEALKRLLSSLPQLAIYGVAIWICAQNKAKNPPLSKRFLSSFIIFGVVAVLEPFHTAWLVAKVAEVPHHGVEILMPYAMTEILLGLAHYAAWIVLVSAIYRVFQPRVSAS